jgi:exodeoxyribonuclease V beta subunit
VATLPAPTAREPDDLAAIKAQRSGFVVTSYTAVKHARGGFVASASEPRMAGELAPGRTDGSDVLPGGAETGIFLHDLLASVALADLADGPSLEDWQALPATAWLLEKLGQRHARPASHLPLAARLVHQAYTTPVRLGGSGMAGLATAKTALREVEFLFPIPERAHPLLSQAQAGVWKVERGVVKGFVDLLFEHDGRVFVCDWKSDALPSFDQDTLARHCGENYDVQARIYTLATLRLCGITTADAYARRFGGVLFYFLRGLREPNAIHFFTPAWQDVLAWETDMLGQSFWGIAR